jgi:hypothetical protein
MEPSPVEQKPNTKGTKIAAKNRERANRLSDRERQQAMGRALELIYRGGRQADVRADRR